MNLEERMAYLQNRLNEAIQNGASYADICMYESAISEMVRISEWIRRQCKKRNKIYLESNGAETRQCIKFRNDTGIDFRFVAMKVNVMYNEQVADTFEIATANWKSGRTAKLYFDTEVGDESILSFDAGSIEYQVMRGETHYEYKH